MSAPRERVVVSVGGSLIAPGDIDTRFLSSFRDLVLKKISEGFTFSIIAGGGATARRYAEAAKKVRGDLSRDDLDWLGIHATRMNGHLLQTLFREYADKAIVMNPTEALDAAAPVVIAAGWRPGWSTDYCAVQVAKGLGARRLANLTNTDYVYTADPQKNKKAKKIEKISWSEFRKLVPAEWDPGIHSPFDPVAAKEAEALGLEVAILNGAHLQEFENYLSGAAFAGTIIS